MSATEVQMSTIRARAYNDTARGMARDGVTLTHEQADDLGEEALDWIGRRLALKVTATGDGVECVPPQPMGRRPRAGEAAKPVTIKATDQERAAWQDAADREGQSLSEWLRAAAELAVARGSTR